MGGIGIDYVGTLEGVARATHDATGIDSPVSAFELAAACGFECLPGARGTASLDGQVLRYDIHARPVRQHGAVAHECAHYLLRLHGEHDIERDHEAVCYTAGALMVPRRRLDAQLRQTWDLDALRALHPNASAEMIARRITQVREAVITVVDQGTVKVRVASPWLAPVSARMTAMESELADIALTTGETQRANEWLWAHALIDGPHRRVIVVAEARQLGSGL